MWVPRASTHQLHRVFTENSADKALALPGPACPFSLLFFLGLWNPCHSEMKPKAIFPGSLPSPVLKEPKATGGPARGVFAAVLELGHRTYAFHRSSVLLTHPPRNLKDLASLSRMHPRPRPCRGVSSTVMGEPRPRQKRGLDLSSLQQGTSNNDAWEPGSRVGHACCLLFPAHGRQESKALSSRTAH